MDITKESFGKTSDGKEVFLFTMKNDKKMIVKVSTFGAAVTSIVVQDKNGEPGNVVLGFDNLSSYMDDHPYLGVICGRFCNRIAKGKFILNNETYNLPINNGPNHLHGGIKGFFKVVWDSEIVKDTAGVSLKLSYFSKDKEEGYPGNLKTTVLYTLTNDNELKISYTASTDQATHVNLTNHAYFNLSAGKAENVLGHQLKIYADRYTPVDDTSIPVGVIESVKNVPAMDFTNPKTIGVEIDKVKGGYDHNYVINRNGDGLTKAASVLEPISGRCMEVYTTEPGVQFYSGNFLDGKFKGWGNKAYTKHYGFCLETQHFPDSPNHTNFPSTILNPGQTFKSVTVYKFGVKR
jgi:aldose 1-epimerase